MSVKEQLFRFIEEKQIDIVCTGGMSIHFNEINAVLNSVKELNPKIKTICGGSVITSDPQLAMNNMKIDIGVIGEGEKTVLELAEALSSDRNVAEVKGIIYYDCHHNLVATQEREPIMDLDSLPIPDYEGFEFDRLVKSNLPNTSWFYTILDEVRPANIISSRSCPYSCTFCYHPLGKKYRKRSLDNVFSEIDYLVKNYNINFIFLMDELFSSNKERMYEFAKRIKAYNLKWATQLRVSDVDEDILRLLKGSGLCMISYGIESLSDEILRSMRKGTTKSQIEKALQITRNEGITIQGNIIIGDPNETEKTVTESLEWWREHKEYGINLGLVKAVPKSPVYENALKSGLIKDKLQFLKDGFPIINLSKLSDRKFRRLSNLVNKYTVFEMYSIIGNVLFSKYENLENGKRLYTIVAECPECHKISKYKNMHQNKNKFSPLYQVICRNCYVKFSISSQASFTKNYTFIERVVLSCISIASKRDKISRLLLGVS